MMPLEHPEQLAALRGRLGDLEPLMKRGIQTDGDTGRQYFTGYEYKTLYDWDQYFEAIIQIYMGWPADYIRNAVTIFLDHQRADGHIARSVPSNEYHDPEHVKPFLAQTALLLHEHYGELDWLAEGEYYERMRTYLEYWLGAMDSTGNGLSEWMSAPHTGMDNQHERAGWWGDRICKGVDLNCYLVREMRAFARLAEALGRRQEARNWVRRADKLKDTIRTAMWDETDGFFYDQSVESGEPIRVRYVGAFAALWARVASDEQAEVMIHQYLFNPEEFWSKYPVPALARSERWYSQIGLPCDLGCDWRAHTWIPTNYYVYRGLRNYGYDQLASLLAWATQRLIAGAGNREYYNAETGEGCGLDPFWGWSLLAHFLPYEEGTDADITAV